MFNCSKYLVENFSKEQFSFFFFGLSESASSGCLLAFWAFNQIISKLDFNDWRNRIVKNILVLQEWISMEIENFFALIGFDGKIKQFQIGFTLNYYTYSWRFWQLDASFFHSHLELEFSWLEIFCQNFLQQEKEKPNLPFFRIKKKNSWPKWLRLDLIWWIWNIILCLKW